MSRAAARSRRVVAGVAVVGVAVVGMLAAGCGERSGEGTAGTTAAGGRTCEGWVTVEAVETATGLPIGDLDLRVSDRGEGRIDCEYDDLDGTTVLKLYAQWWAGGIVRNDIVLREGDAARDGPVEGSVIAPIGRDEDDPAIMGQARFERDTTDHGLGVVLEDPAEGHDPYDLVGRLLEELWASAEGGVPGAT